MPVAIPASERVAIFPKRDIMSECLKIACPKRRDVPEDVCLTNVCLKNVVRE